MFDQIYRERQIPVLIPIPVLKKVFRDRDRDPEKNGIPGSIPGSRRGLVPDGQRNLIFQSQLPNCLKTNFTGERMNKSGNVKTKKYP